MDAPTVRDNLARAREEIANITAREGLAASVRVIGVTKGHSARAVSIAAEVGLADVGENRVQEALGKQEVLDVPVAWHLIGHLQTNKAKLVPGRFAFVHSVDSNRLANALGKAVRADGAAPPLPVLIQVNVSGETVKSGCPPDETSALAHTIDDMPELVLEGLMTMAPFTNDETIQRRVFSGLRGIRDELESEGLRLPELSMGMSGDFRSAVAEGATMVRLGTVLFGGRGK